MLSTTAEVSMKSHVIGHKHSSKAAEHELWLTGEALWDIKDVKGHWVSKRGPNKRAKDAKQ